ncbi:MAG TPA: hypothetical protein H9667_05275 [Firmicutes bacterium]|nr:hypothetical protein [Bacillota bacterium]
MNTIQRTVSDIATSSLKTTNRDIALKEGQVIVGRVKQTNSNGTTQLVVGDREISVRVQGESLRENGIYAFKVLQTSGDMIELKPYLPSQLSSQNFSELVRDLLSHFRLNGNDLAKTLIEGLLQRSSPLQRNHIIQMLSLVQNTKLTPEVLQTLDFMNKNGIAFDKNIFQAILATHTKVPMSQVFTQFMQTTEHMNFPSLEGLRQWASNFGKNQQTLQMLANMPTARAEVPKNFSKNDLAFQELSPKMLPRLTAESVMTQLKAQFPTLTSNELHVLVRGMNQALVQVLPKVLNQLGDAQGKQLLQALVNSGRITFSETLKEGVMPKLVSQFSLDLAKGSRVQPQSSVAVSSETTKVQGQQTVILRTSPDINGNTEMRREQTESVQKATFVSTPNSVSISNLSSTQPTTFETAVASFIKDSIMKLGLNFESMLQSTNKNESLEEQFKPLLIKIMEDVALPSSVRKDAEALLTRFTGQQIISQFSDTILQNYHISIPLFGMGLNSDLEISWQSKRKADGSLDPDFCRIIFDVKLNEIGRTVMDMQIVDRIIGLNVYTEQSIEEIGNLYIEDLKKGLEEKGYYLGNVDYCIFELTEEEEEMGFHFAMMERLEQTDYKGFDFRI